MKKRVLSLILAFLLAATLLTACGSNESATVPAETAAPEAAAPEAPKVFNMAIDAMPEVLNPTDGTDSVIPFLMPLYEKLYGVNADGEYTFYLAESCDVSEDGLTYTLKLRKDAAWSDGTPITAKDVAFTVEYHCLHRTT